LALVTAVLAACAVVATGWIILNLLVQQGRLLQRIEALEAAAPRSTRTAASPTLGSRAPAFRLPAAHGRMVGISDFGAMRWPVLLVFSDASCGPCDELIPDIARFQRDLRGNAQVLVVSTGSGDAVRAKTAGHGLEIVLLDTAGEAAARYGSPPTPSALLLDESGRVASEMAVGELAIKRLVTRVANGNATGEEPQSQPAAPRHNLEVAR
jgi:methylamine dehydrogenase accessory protein MauD